MEIKSLENTSFAAISAAFNAAFVDYMVPIVTTPESVAERFRQEDFARGLSTGAFDAAGDLVGFMLHALREIDGRKIAYNGGTGVVPAHRGHKLTARQYAMVLPRMRELGVQEIWLEVIDSNAAAIHTYGKLGFEKTRDLDCLTGIGKPGNSEAEIRALAHADWDAVQRWWDILPTWQNDLATTANLGPDILVRGAFWGGALVAYVAARPNGRILHGAVARGFRGQGIGGDLLAALQQDFEAPLAAINVEARPGGPADFLRHIGFERTIGQLEMRWVL